MSSLLGVDALVFDLDGVVNRREVVIPGAGEAIERVRALGMRVIFATNNATRSPEELVEKLGRMSIHATPSEFVTSTGVLLEEIEKRGWSGRSAFLIGTGAVHKALTENGIKVLDADEGRNAEIVITSGDPGFTYDKLRTAGFALHAGAEFLATNADATFPSPEGLWPGAGSLLAAVETVAGRRAEVMGKPHLPMMKSIARRLTGCKQIGLVGDQPATDLEGARAMGWRTILVLSGVTDAVTAATLDPAPDLVLDSLADLQL